MKIIIDAQLPPALAGWLRDAGHEAVHVEGVDLRNADDDAVWAYALQNQAALMTKDEDFAARSARAASAPLIVWLRVGNATNRALRAWMEPRMPGIVELVEAGHRLIEVR